MLVERANTKEGNGEKHGKNRKDTRFGHNCTGILKVNEGVELDGKIGISMMENGKHY